VEQQYQKAVNLVIKTRSYVDGLTKLKTGHQETFNVKSASAVPAPQGGNEKALLALGYVNDRAAHLAQTIKNSLSLLPNSPLWGMQELFKRLKLLIALNEYRLAAEGFAQIKVIFPLLFFVALFLTLQHSQFYFQQEQSIQGAIFSVEITSDTLQYCYELSWVFYHELSDATITYYQLFDEQKDNFEITGLLLGWIETQISVYVQMIVRQVRHQHFIDLFSFL